MSFKQNNNSFHLQYGDVIFQSGKWFCIPSVVQWIMKDKFRQQWHRLIHFKSLMESSKKKIVYRFQVLTKEKLHIFHAFNSSSSLATSSRRFCLFPPFFTFFAIFFLQTRYVFELQNLFSQSRCFYGLFRTHISS